MFYVYEWYIKSTGYIFYVGKGSGNRYKVTKGRNKLFEETIKNNDCDSRIIQYFENEHDAFQYEDLRIKELKEDGQCSCNINPGGAGGTSEYWTPQLRQAYSENNVMKRPEQRKRMSENNPMKNKEISERVAKSKSRPVIINNHRYSSVKEVAKVYHTSNDVIRNWCIKGINQYGELCRYEDEEQVIYSGNRYNLGSSKPVIYRGIRYESEIDLCDAIGIGYRTCCDWLKRGFNPKGEPVRYEDDDRDLVFINEYSNRKRNRPIIVNGVKYKSVSEAAKILDIPKSTLRRYVKGITHNPKYICAYDDQQPSQENIS